MSGDSLRDFSSDVANDRAAEARALRVDYRDVEADRLLNDSPDGLVRVDDAARRYLDKVKNGTSDELVVVADPAAEYAQAKEAIYETVRLAIDSANNPEWNKRAAEAFRATRRDDHDALLEGYTRLIATPSSFKRTALISPFGSAITEAYGGETSDDPDRQDVISLFWEQIEVHAIGSHLHPDVRRRLLDRTPTPPREK